MGSTAILLASIQVGLFVFLVTNRGQYETHERQFLTHISSNLLVPDVADENITNAQQSDQRKIAIFYNTFSRARNSRRAKTIITNQLQDVNAQPLLNGATLYYTRVGLLDWDWPMNICRGIEDGNELSTTQNKGNTTQRPLRQCIELAAVPIGDEVLSLQPLYEYCVNNRRDRVVYMHSKGTYTPTRMNDQLRSILMKAILSDECLTMPSDGSCDTCSTRFSPFQFFTYTGNMFVAQCSYVSKLIPPKDFELRKRKVIETRNNDTKRIDSKWSKTILTNETSYKFETRLTSWSERMSWIGLDRYAMEHWIGSHPSLNPCEVFASADNNPGIGYGRIVSPDDFQPPKLRKIKDTMTSNVSEKFWTTMKGEVRHPWYLPVGRLYEYRQLYSTIPQNDSWFYTLWSKYEMPPKWVL